MPLARQAYGRRRWALVCCCTAMGALVPVALFQLRLLKKLPDPPGPIFNSPKIVTSKAAFPFGIPDGLLGVGSYGVTLALLAAAGTAAGAPGRRLELALKAKLLVDGSMAGWNMAKQWRCFRSICSWCTAAAAATGAMVYFGYSSARPLGRAPAQEDASVPSTPLVMPPN